MEKEKNARLIAEKISQIFEIAARINLETTMVVFAEMSGHVSTMKVRVAKEKDNWNDTIHTQELRYSPYVWKHESPEQLKIRVDEDFKCFMNESDQLIKELNTILSRTWTEKFTAYCSLSEMSCSQVFISEDAAKKWVRKMNRKYKSVYAMVGYERELV